MSTTRQRPFIAPIARLSTLFARGSLADAVVGVGTSPEGVRLSMGFCDESGFRALQGRRRRACERELRHAAGLRVKGSRPRCDPLRRDRQPRSTAPMDRNRGNARFGFDLHPL
jgi:hypothetical protein